MKSAQAERWGGLGDGPGPGGTDRGGGRTDTDAGPARARGGAPAGLGPHSLTARGLGALCHLAQEINDVPWAGETQFSPVAREGFVPPLAARVSLILWLEKPGRFGFQVVSRTSFLMIANGFGDLDLYELTPAN